MPIRKCREAIAQVREGNSGEWRRSLRAELSRLFRADAISSVLAHTRSTISSSPSRGEETGPTGWE
jgi:hypothetical protein